MSIAIILLSALHSSLSAPLLPPHNDSDHGPPALFGRELPNCLDVAHYRTKQDVVVSCLATILACTWVAIHPNLPGPRDSWWAKMKRKMTMMIYAMLAPEFVAYWALRQWRGAGRIADEFNKKHNRSSACLLITAHRSGAHPWVLEVGTKDPQTPEAALWYMQVVCALKTVLVGIRSGIEECFMGPARILPTEWTRTHRFFIQMGGFMLFEGRMPVWALQFDELMEMIEKGEVDVPNITEDEINDKSKGDFFTKLVVVLQTTWFVVQCSARWAIHLPVTNLEVATLAFALLNVVTYALWWRKPQNVAVAIRVQRKHGPEEDEEGQGLLEGREEKERWITKQLRNMTRKGWLGWVFGVPAVLLWALVRPLTKMGEEGDFNSGLLWVPMFWADHQAQASDVIPLSAIGLLFGAVHLVPWSTPFPSPAQLWLWRSSALFITVEPLMVSLSVLAVHLDGRYHHRLSNSFAEVTVMAAGLGALLYVVAHLILLVLAFTTLRNLLPGTYTAIVWTTFVPHL